MGQAILLRAITCPEGSLSLSVGWLRHLLPGRRTAGGQLLLLLKLTLLMADELLVQLICLAAAAQELNDAVEDEASKPGLPVVLHSVCLLYTSPSPRDRQKSRMPSSA